MSSKSDRDNRSNQLNSNNSAYHSSRGTSRSEDDEDTDYTPRSGLNGYSLDRHRSMLGSSARAETFAFGAVSMDGRAMYRTATFVAPGAVLSKSASRVQLEEYLDGFCTLARIKLERSLGSSKLAIFAVFDPTESCLSWHIPLMQQDLQTTRASIVPRRLQYLSDRLRPTPAIEGISYSVLEMINPGAGKRAEETNRVLASTKLDPSPFLEALRAAVIDNAESWGEFSVSNEGRMGSEEQQKVSRQLDKV